MKNNIEFKKTYLYKLNILLLSFLLTFSNVLSDGTLFVSAEGEEEVPQETTEVIPEETPEVTLEVTPEVTPEPTEVPTVEVVGVPFEQKKVVDAVEITVSAEAGVFPEGSTLSVTKVPYYVKKQVTEAIDQVRDEEKTVAVSYTFDIKVLKDGVEVQPKDMNKVKVSFKMVEVQNENLTTEVYHIDDSQNKITSDNVTALETITEEDVATVETEGFSIYTVEFIYNNKQYILEGDTYVKLEDILSSVALTGNVDNYEVSNSELFNIYKSNEDGVEYIENYDDNGNLVEYYPVNKEDGNTLYMVALQPFTSEEWLKVTIDGIEYTIVVTDAIRMDENGDQVGTNVNFMQESTAIGIITDSRVIQGPLEDNFTASMPLAEIYIDDTIVNQTLWRQDQYNGDRVIAELLVDNTQGKYKGFKINTDPEIAAGNNMASSYGALYYSFSERYLNDTQTLTVSGSSANNYEKFSGDIVRYTLKGMATKFDPVANEYKNYDVVITYSDLLITLAQNSGTGSVNQANIGDKLMLIDTNMVNFKWTGGFRAGLEYNVNVKVVDPDTGELIDGSYYYPMADIDVGRNGIGGFANLYNASNLNRYSEQVALMSNYGRPTSSGSWEQMVWIPGGNYSAAPFTNKANVTEDNYPYTCNITSKTIDGQANTLLISPGGTTTAVSGKISTASGVDKDNSFYSGFITLANNTAGGINVKGYASAPTSGGVESYVLTGSQIVNHKVDASSDVGGTIFTTTTGNSDGSLSGGTLLGYNEINKPFEISAATGQSVTYTMTPKGGYKLKRVWVKDGDIDIMTIVNTAKATVNENDYDTNSDGELDENERQAYEAAVQTAINYALASDTHTSEIPIPSLTSLGKGVYAYTFTGIQENKSIHIDWEKTDLTVTKKLDPTMTGGSEKFKFQIKLTDTSTQETTWRVRAKKNTGLFEWNMGVEDGTPYYMAYYEWKDETVPYKYVEVTDTTDKNPSEEGWYYLADGAYYLSTDTEPKPEVTYYIKDETQTSTIRIYRYHILGWNETTQTWDNREITGGNEIVSGSNLGTVNLDTELSDNYRFISDGNYVYNTASYNAATESYDEYLMWIYDDASGEYVLVSGNSETYPQGTTFSPTTSAPDFLYVFRDGVENYSNKVIRTDTSQSIDGETYPRNGAENKYVFKQDANTPIYYNLITNPNGYALNSGYTVVEGESGVYIVTLPAGQNPITADLEADGWDVTVSRVGAIEDDFDLDQAMADAGAKSVAGAVNTYEFELGVDETIDFNGVIPMGWNYEITEILPANSIWELEGTSGNDTINDFDGDEDVTFTNKEKRYDITIEKQTVDNKAGTFDFTIEIYKEEVVTPAQNQNITIQAYKNSGEASPTYKLTNSGDPIELEMNGKSTTIPTDEYIKGSGSPLDLVISDLLDMDNTSNVQITMNGDSGNVSTTAVTSVTNQVAAFDFFDEYTSFSLEPVTFTLSTPGITNKTWYTPSTVPTGFNGTSGTFTFTLSNNESKTFTDIPYGYKYEIKETVPTGWENVDKINEVGTLTSDITSTWKNDITKHNLTIHKDTVNNDSGTFNFEVKVWGEKTVLADTVKELGGFNNDSTATLAHTNTDTLQNYFGTSTQTFNTDFYLYSNNTKVATLNYETSTWNGIEFDHDTWRIKNNWFTNKSGSFGHAWNVGDMFSLRADEYLSSDGQTFVLDNSSKYTFTLDNGGTKVIPNIPYGYKYEVYEVDSNGNKVLVGGNIDSTDWKLKSITGDSNTGTITDDTYVNFTNELVHDLTIKKETVNNVEGTFNYELIIYGLENIFTADMGEGNNAYRPLSNQEFNYVSGLDFANTVQYNDDPTYCVIEYYDDTEGREYVSSNGNMIYSSNSFELHGGDHQWYVDPNQISADSADLWPEALSADVLTLKALRFYNIEADSYDYKVSYDTDKFNVDYLGYVNKFTLANGESKTISNIPHGYKYEVYEETQEGWQLVDIDGSTTFPVDKGAGGTSGTITQDTVHVFNNKLLLYDLTVKKIVSGNMGNKYKDFEFTLITDSPIASEDGTVITRPDETKKRPDQTGELISQDVDYLAFRLGEHPVIAYADGTGAFKVLTIDYEDEEAIRNNTVRNAQTLFFSDDYALVAYKENSTMYLFEFIDGNANWYVYENTSSLDEITYKATFTLKHDETITFKDIPYNEKYILEEADYSGIGYITKVDDTLGRRVEKNIKEDTTHVYENNLSAVIPTKAFGGMITPMIGLMMIAIFWFIMDYRKKKKILDEELDE